MKLHLKPGDAIQQSLTSNIVNSYLASLNDFISNTINKFKCEPIVYIERDSKNLIIDLYRYYITINLEGNTNVKKKGINYIERQRVPIITTSDLARYFFKVQITGYEESFKLFGYKNKKKEMYNKSLQGEIFGGIEFFPDMLCKKDNIVRNIIAAKYQDRLLKFSIDEVKFIGLDLNNIIKGLNPVKDRTINIGSMVKVSKKNKKYPIKTKLVVKSIDKINKYCLVEDEYKKLSNLKLRCLKVI